MSSTSTVDFDLSSTGIVAQLPLTHTDQNFGVQFESDAAVDVVIEIAGRDGPFFAIREFSQVQRIDDGFQGPEVDTVRLRTTSTATGTADALVGAGGE
jgi:hypothetical protein